MGAMLELVRDHPRRTFEAGETVIEQDGHTGMIFVLLAGEVEVLRDGIVVSSSAQAGALFGEMAVLLESGHTATVRARTRSTFAMVENPQEFLGQSAAASLEVARLLARRLDSLSKYLIDVKRQYEGHDHLGMVDEVIEALMHLPPRKRPS